MTEQHKDVIGYEGLYQVSNTGKICSKRKILKARIQNRGYACVCLSKQGIKKTFSVHRLVMMSFEQREGKFDVNHKDGNKLNNTYPDNLEWCTHSENVKHYYSSRKINESSAKYYSSQGE
jgi:hypothetical protein